MKKRLMQCVAVVAALSVPAAVFAAPKAVDVSYKKDVTPIIHDYCQSCHEPGGKGYEASGLDLRSYQGLMKGTKFGAVVKPGDSFTSILIQVIEGRVHPSIKMPYGMSGGLSKENISILKRWVEQGAKDN